uniref:hypothetical protein n=1 Tax=Pseudomonas sp. JAI120 TaxID=2723063 RepID=UPI0030DA842C
MHQQRIAAIKSGETPDVKGCKEAPVILDAWGTLESSQRESQSRISQLENDLEAARELLRESAASASTHAFRFDWVNRASSEGLWDMEVVAGDPINPKNRFWWSPQFRNLLGFNDERDFPNVLASLNAFGAHLNDNSGKTPFDIEIYWR